MRKTTLFMTTLLIAVVIGGCGNSGVSQEEYDKVVVEREELKNQLENKEKPAINFFEEIEGVTASESGDLKRKVLMLTCYIKLYENNDTASEMSSSIGEKIRSAQTEEWFDYDYILIDFWSESMGRIVSMTIDANNLSEPMQINEWYGRENGEQKLNDSMAESHAKQEESSQKVENNNIKAEVIEEYYYINSIGSAQYFLIVKNISDETISVNINATAKDAEGNLIGAKTKSEEAIPSGYEVCIGCYFSDAKNAASFEYTIDAKKDEYYEAVIQNLTYEESRTDKKVIISCTNNGNDAAKFVEATALFFSNGELVRSDSTYITDDDSEIKPGATIIKEMKSYDEYDDVKIYLSGRK